MWTKTQGLTSKIIVIRSTSQGSLSKLAKIDCKPDLRGLKEAMVMTRLLRIIF